MFKLYSFYSLYLPWKYTLVPKSSPVILAGFICHHVEKIEIYADLRQSHDQGLKHLLIALCYHVDAYHSAHWQTQEE